MKVLFLITCIMSLIMPIGTLWATESGTGIRWGNSYRSAKQRQFKSQNRDNDRGVDEHE